MAKLEKIECEICGNKETATLHLHHIIERTNINTSNNEFNLCVICANCHNLIHVGKRLKIIGVFPSTRPPHGRTVIYELDGKYNLDGIKEPYINQHNNVIKI